MAATGSGAKPAEIRTRAPEADAGRTVVTPGSVRGLSDRAPVVTGSSQPSHTVRFPLSLLLIAVAASLACRDTTWPDVTPAYTLTAYTTPDVSASPPDSVTCEIMARWSSPDTLVVPWSGAVDVVASRSKRGEPLVASSVRRGTATLSIVNGPGDSVHVTLAGTVNLSFHGRMPTASSDATGQWTCGTDATFGTTVPGEAHGTWYLSRERLIG